MHPIPIDADAMFRAVTASGYKLLAYNLNLNTGEIVSRTLRPDEVAPAPAGSLVKPLPKLGGDLAPKKDAAPFGPPPVQTKKKLFNDEDGLKKPVFDAGFFKREEKKKPNLFADGGFQRENGVKKLAEIFGERGERGEGSSKKPADPFARPAGNGNTDSIGMPDAPAASEMAPDTRQNNSAQHIVHIPSSSEEEQVAWMHAFAKHSGDPEIRDALGRALKAAKPIPAFEKVLRKYQRTGQQWESYFRKQALQYGEAWLSSLGIQWELVESAQRSSPF